MQYELAQYFEPLIPHCTPQYIMAIIRPLIHNSCRDFQGIVTRIEEKDNVFFDIKTLNHLKQNPKWHEEEIRSYENNPFLKWHFLKDDLIFENEQVPQIPKI